MQDKDRAALARKIAAAVFDMAERDNGLTNPRLTETIETILAEFKPDDAYRQMIGKLFSKTVTPADWNAPHDWYNASVR